MQPSLAFLREITQTASFIQEKSSSKNSCSLWASSQNRLGRDLGVPPQRICDIIHARRAITTDTALRLGVYFRVSAEFWLNLQKSYDLRKARAEGLADRIVRDVRPLPVHA